MEKIRRLIERYREIILYVVCGALTTVVDMAIYYPLHFALPDGFVFEILANCTAWVGAVLFAFFVNKTVVFSDGKKEVRTVLAQLAAFAGARTLSLGIETLLLLAGNALLETLGIGGLFEYLPKLFAQIFVVIVNYVISKFLVFRKK